MFGHSEQNLKQLNEKKLKINTIDKRLEVMYLVTPLIVLSHKRNDAYST